MENVRYAYLVEEDYAGVINYYIFTTKKKAMTFIDNQIEQYKGEGYRLKEDDSVFIPRFVELVRRGRYNNNIKIRLFQKPLQ